MNRKIAGTLMLIGAALMFAVLVKLGFWQLDRAAQKAAIRADYEARAAEPPITLGARALEPSLHEYYRAEAGGVYEPAYQVLIDNAVLDGRPGYRVITPLNIDGTGKRVLVDRGWIPWGADRADVPDAPAPTGRVRVEGRLERPAGEYYTLEDAPPAAGQRVWQNLDLDHYRALHDFKVEPLILRLSPEAQGAGGFERRVPAYSDEWIARHRGYAATWFGLAVVLVAGVAALLWRRRGQEENHG